MLLALAFLLFPLSIGIAILRYHLYDIDIIIRRTLVYVPLTAILAGVFAASIKLTQALFAGLAGTQSEATTVLTTLIVVAAFEPLKGWLQRMVNARFKEGPDPEQRWKDYGQQVRDVCRDERRRSQRQAAAGRSGCRLRGTGRGGLPAAGRRDAAGPHARECAASPR